MALLDWDESLSIGVKEMDRQHQVLVEMLNELHSSMMAGNTHEILGALLHKLVEYAKFHFHAEEEFLSAEAFPALTAHHQLHEDMTKELQVFVDRYERGEEMIHLHLMSFLRDWLMHHILQEDRGYGQWVTRNTGR